MLMLWEPCLQALECLSCLCEVDLWPDYLFTKHLVIDERSLSGLSVQRAKVFMQVVLVVISLLVV